MALPANFKQDPQGASVSVGSQAADVLCAMKIKWVGDPADAASPEVTVAGTAGIDLAFYTVASTTKDTATFPTTDTHTTTAGEINLDASAADVTFGTIQDVINGKDNWSCVLVGALRTALIYDHTGGATEAACPLLAMAAAADGADALREEGAVLLYDTTALDQTGACMGPEVLGSEFARFDARRSENNVQITDPDYAVNGREAGEVMQARDRVSFITSISQSAGTGAPQVNVYSAGQTGTPTLVHTYPGATTVATTTFEHNPLFSKPGERLVVNVTLDNSAVDPIINISGGFGWYE